MGAIGRLAILPRLSLCPNYTSGMTDQSARSQANQRASHRIEEDVLLAWRAIEADADPHRVFEPSGLAELTQRLQQLDLQFRECHARLARVDAVAAEAIQLLDAKVSALRDAVAQAEAQRGDGAPQLERVHASIGATGIGFPAQRALGLGATVALHVVLLPQRESIIARGRVTQCRTIEGGWYLGAEFADLSEHDQRRLTRHVLKAEITRRK